MAARPRKPTFSISDLTPDDVTALRDQFPALRRDGRPEPLPPDATAHGEATLFRMIVEMTPEILGLASAILTFVSLLKESRSATARGPVPREDRSESSKSRPRSKKNVSKRPRR